MAHGGARKAREETREGLWRQGDFWHQYERLLAPAQHSGDGLQVYLGLTASCHALQQNGLIAAERANQCTTRGGLLICQFDLGVLGELWRRVIRRVGNEFLLQQRAQQVAADVQGREVAVVAAVGQDKQLCENCGLGGCPTQR